MGPSSPFGPLAGWWHRFGATIIDGVLFAIVGAILRAIFGYAGGTIVTFVGEIVYFTLLLSRRGQTVGNMAVGTRVVDARTGGPISVGKALGRFFSEILLFILLVIPWILDILWPLWDQKNQTLHDKMAGTLVIKTQ